MNQQAKKMGLGATGNFPDGKISNIDEGDLVFALSYNKKHKIFYLNFGKPVSWLAIPKDEALKFANVILNKISENEE